MQGFNTLKLHMKRFFQTILAALLLASCTSTPTSKVSEGDLEGEWVALGGTDSYIFNPNGEGKQNNFVLGQVKKMKWKLEGDSLIIQQIERYDGIFRPGRNEAKSYHIDSIGTEGNWSAKHDVLYLSYKSSDGDDTLHLRYYRK